VGLYLIAVPERAGAPLLIGTDRPTDCHWLVCSTACYLAFSVSPTRAR